MELQEQYDLLIEAREWLDDPAHWTRGTSWRDSNGKRVQKVQDATIAQTCAVGALTLFGGVETIVITTPAFTRITPVIHLLDSCTPSNFDSIIGLNDAVVGSSTQAYKQAYEQVLETYDRAIELLRQLLPPKQLESEKELVLA